MRLFTQKELWYEMFAAVLGVIITAIITMILLRGQSDNDVERERASKVFEEKLRIYQEYLQTLYDVIKDGSLSDEEKMQLEFQTSYVAMHCSPCYIASVSTAVKKIIEYTCSEESKEINGGGKSNTLSHYWKICFAWLKPLEKTYMVLILNSIQNINKQHYSIFQKLIETPKRECQTNR